MERAFPSELEAFRTLLESDVVPIAVYWGTDFRVESNALFRQYFCDLTASSARDFPVKVWEWLQLPLERTWAAHSGERLPDFETCGTTLRSFLLPLSQAVLHISIDVTADVNALRQANDFLRFALENAQMGAWELVDGQENVHRTIQHDHLFGYDTLLPRWNFQVFLEHLLPEDRPELNRRFQEALDKGEPWTIEHRIRRKDGSIRWLWSAGRLHSAIPGRPQRLTGIVQDITERRTIEDALRDAQTKLIESDKRKNSFLAMLSHELRNPLTPILYALTLLEKSPAGSDKAQQAIVMLRRQVEQLVQLTNELLDVTRIASGKVVLEKQRVDLNTIVSQAFEDYRPLMDELKLKVTVSIPPQPSWIDADEKRISQVLRNLLHNATKFSKTGGVIEVSVTQHVASQLVEVSIHDSGQGIEPEVMAHLFEPFIQADMTLERRKGGLGLGLALVKGLVEQHGGHVHAESAGRDQGANFIFTLPLFVARTETAAAIPSAHVISPRRVLIIEDNVDAAQALRDLLTMDGHHVEIAHDGHEGVESALAFRPQIVFCDIGLPGMDGFEVARTFRSLPQLRHLRMVALSGYALPHDVQKAIAAGFDAHVSKPPAMEKIEQLIAETRPQIP